MKRSLLALLMMTSSAVAFGATDQRPDYSKPTILKILHQEEVEDRKYKIDIGMAQLRTKYVRYHFAFLPLLGPLPYSGPHGAGQLPNPFVLTGTEYAWRPHQWTADPEDYEDAEYRKEYKRVQSMLKKQKVVVTTQ